MIASLVVLSLLGPGGVSPLDHAWRISTRRTVREPTFEAWRDLCETQVAGR